MPRFVAPGVYVEEVSFRQKAIAGVETSTAGFVGPTGAGHDNEEPVSLYGFDDFERIYGGLASLDGSTPNHVAHAARAFFENGGKRLHVAATKAPLDPDRARSGLAALARVGGISIVAAPGSTAGYRDADRLGRRAIEEVQELLIDHCGALRHRFAVLDTPDGLGVGEVLTYRKRFDSKDAAIYYPWVTVIDPSSRDRIDLPPSGFVAGIYAKNDLERGVHKSPANEEVGLAVDLERHLDDTAQAQLNPAGVNCLRSFTGRGIVIWGARTMSSENEWRYVAVRRYLGYLEASIEDGTKWVVFEPNDEPLWANARRAIEDFLMNEWRGGAIVGAKPEEAFFVRCDRSTMTQADLDEGRMICLVGVAPVRPSEFAIFRITQRTVESGS